MRSQIPPDTPEYWDDVISSVDKKSFYLDLFLGQLKKQAHIDLIKRWGGFAAKGLILKTDLFEEAVGRSAYLNDFVNEKSQVIGIDISPVVVKKAKARDSFQKASYVAADVRYLPFKSNTFAFIMSPSTLDHFPNADDLRPSLAELVRILEPGGTLIVTLDNRQNIFDPFLRLVNRLGWIPYFVGRSYTIKELNSEICKFPLAIQDETAILHNPRLLAVGMVEIANRLNFPPLTIFVRYLLMQFQKLEHTCLRYFTGSFIAIKAIKR